MVPAAAGLLSSSAMVVVGSKVGAVPIHATWWFRISSASWIAYLAFYLAFAGLIISWLAIGRLARRRRLSIGRCWSLLIAWGGPFLLGPPLFSRDLYSYVVQGLLARQGRNPATTSPEVIGHGAQWWSIASVWRSTPSPYGPLWVTISSGTASLSGQTLVRQVITMRSLEMIGVVLMMVCLPILARRQNADPGLALWLAVLSPLGLISFLASGHNEAIMLGLMVAGGAAVVSGRLGLGMGIAAAAGTIKLPALALPGFLGLDALVRSPGRRWRTAAVVLGVPVAVVVGLTLLGGEGLTWVSAKALRIPTELHILLSPSVSVAVFFAGLAHALGLDVATTSVIAVVQPLFELLAVVAIGWMAITIRRRDPVRTAGIALLTVALCSPTFWPWYFTWGLVLLAATSAQRSRVLAASAGFAMCLVTPGGSPVLQNPAWIVTGPLVLFALGWLLRGGKWRRVVDSND